MSYPDTTPTSLADILARHNKKTGVVMPDGTTVYSNGLSDDEALAAIEALIPEKRKLYEPVTKREVMEGGNATIDLLMDMQGSLVFIQDNGYNQAIDQIHRNFKGRPEAGEGE